MAQEAWRGFTGTHWRTDVNVRDFIQNNYTQYDGDESFLEGPTKATDTLWGELQQLQKAEREREQLMSPGVDHINRVFKGDERYMMLQAYYRLHSYKPVYALRSSLPLLP